MTYFDYRLISDPAIQTDYRHLEYRSKNIASSIMQAYGREKKPIAFRFINEGEFNAFASVDDDRNHYQVEVNAAVPLLVMMLFYRLFSDKRVLPLLDPDAAPATNFELPFILNPETFDRPIEWQVSTSAIRGFAAGTVADLCSTFVVLHEFGHIICGHADGIRHYEKGEKLAELVSRARQPGNLTERRKRALERRKAWERDADMIAAIFLVQFVEDLANPALTEPRTRRVFSDADGFNLEHTLAIAVAALFAFFCYVQGSRQKLEKQSSHPHPQVRSLFVKDMLVQELSKRRKLDTDKFHDLMMERLEEMMNALADIDLLDTSGFTAAFDRTMDQERKGLETLHAAHKDSCAQWRWFDW